MKKIIFAGIILAASAISCQKDSNPDPNPPAVTYMSFTAGQARNYMVTDNTTSTSDNYTLTSTDRDSTVNGKSYHVFTNSTGPNEYYNITGNDYFQFAALPDVLGGTNEEMLYLKTNAAVGTNWNKQISVPVSGLPLPLVVTLTNTITEINSTKVVNSITYNNVIKVETSVSVAGVPASAVTSDIDSYYAPKYGLIENHYVIGINYMGVVENVDTQVKLMSANF